MDRFQFWLLYIHDLSAIVTRSLFKRFYWALISSRTNWFDMILSLCRAILEGLVINLKNVRTIYIVRQL